MSCSIENFFVKTTPPISRGRNFLAYNPFFKMCHRFRTTNRFGWLVDNVPSTYTEKIILPYVLFHDNMSHGRRTPREDTMWWNFKVLTTAFRAKLNFYDISKSYS
jgi:hypothetical protein